MIGAAFANRSSVLLALCPRRLGVALAQLAVTSVDLANVTRLGVDEGEQTDIGQFELARIEDLDDQRIME